MGFVIVMVAFLAMMWLFVIRPQRAAAVKRQALIESVDIGDEILTAGGLYATVTGVGDETDELFVEIAEGVEVRVDRRSIGSIVRKDEDVADENDGVEHEELDAGDPENGVARDVAAADEQPGPLEPERR